MFRCVQCPSTFTSKGNLVAHQKMHAGVRFQCNICATSFTKKSNLKRHIENIHAVTRVQPVLQPREIEITSNIIVPDQAAGLSNQNHYSNNIPNEHFDDGYDEMCLEVLNHAENAGLCDKPGSDINRRVHSLNNVPDTQFKSYVDNLYSDDDICMTALNEFENKTNDGTMQDLCTTNPTAVNVEITPTAYNGSTRKTKKCDSAVRNQLIAVHSENLRKGVLNGRTNNQPFPTLKNGSPLRELYEEYLEVQNLEDRMMNWASHAGSLCKQLNLDFTVLGMLMMDFLIDFSIPIDEDLLQMLNQDLYFSTERIKHYTQYSTFMHLIYGLKRLMDIKSEDLKSRQKSNWMKNTITILRYFKLTGDTADFMIERMENLI